MKTIEEVLKQIDEDIEKPFVTAQFGDIWKSHAIDHYDFPDVVNIAWKQGRRAILLERVLRELFVSLPSSKSVITDEEIKILLSDIDNIAREYDQYEYGLPLYHDKETNVMVKIVRKWMRSKLQSSEPERKINPEWHDALVKLADDLRSENIELKKQLAEPEQKTEGEKINAYIFCECKTYQGMDWNGYCRTCGGEINV
jgi:hypothetical protein